MSAKFTRRIGVAQALRGVAPNRIQLALVLVPGRRGFKTPRPRTERAARQPAGVAPGLAWLCGDRSARLPPRPRPLASTATAAAAGVAMPLAAVQPQPRGLVFQPGYTRRMYTQCPHCLCVFVVEAARLGSAHGHVRCGQCAALFDALPTLCDELPAEPYVTLPRQDGTAPAPQLDALVAPPEPAEMLAAADSAAVPIPPAEPARAAAPAIAPDALRVPAADAANTMPFTVDTAGGAEHEVAAHTHAHDPPVDAAATAPVAAIEPQDTLPALHAAMPEGAVATREDDVAPPAAAPVFANRPGGRRAPLWGLLALLLVLALAAQVGWLLRAALVRNAVTRPWLLDVCRVLAVPPPQVRAPALLRLDARDIRRHPDVPDALLISATLHNTAPWTQPYPQLEVRLSDLAGHAVAARVFAPTAYLPDAALAARGLPPGARAAISIEIRDPGRQAVAFEIVPR